MGIRMSRISEWLQVRMFRGPLHFSTLPTVVGAAAGGVPQARGEQPSAQSPPTL